MKRTHSFALFTVLAGTTLSMSNGFYSDLLTPDDYRFQHEEARTRGPALSAPLDGKTPYWESFNQWLCLPAGSVEVTCLEADYAGSAMVPTIHVLNDGHYYEISMDPEPKPDCETITRHWAELLNGEHAFCAYAAPLQEYDGDLSDTGAKDGSVWIINRLKTGKGYWNFESPENWEN